MLKLMAKFTILRLIFLAMQGTSKKSQLPCRDLCRDFPRPDLGSNIGSSQFKNEQKLPKMVYIIPNFLVLHFGKNFMKIQTKIPKLQMHEKLHKNVNENMFSSTFLCNFS